MRDMQMDKTELGCLRAIVLFNPGTACRPGLVSAPQGAKAAGRPPQPHIPLIGRCRPPAPPLSLPLSLAMGSAARDLEPGWSGGAGGAPGQGRALSLLGEVLAVGGRGSGRAPESLPSVGSSAEGQAGVKMGSPSGDSPFPGAFVPRPVHEPMTLATQPCPVGPLEVERDLTAGTALPAGAQTWDCQGQKGGGQSWHRPRYRGTGGPAAEESAFPEVPRTPGHCGIHAGHGAPAGMSDSRGRAGVGAPGLGLRGHPRAGLSPGLPWLQMGSRRAPASAP